MSSFGARYLTLTVCCFSQEYQKLTALIKEMIIIHRLFISGNSSGSVDHKTGKLINLLPYLLNKHEQYLDNFLLWYIYVQLPIF